MKVGTKTKGENGLGAAKLYIQQKRVMHRTVWSCTMGGN